MCDDLRKFYEDLIGRVSDTTWFRLKAKFAKYNFDLTKTNLQMYVQIKSNIRRTKLKDLELVKVFSEIEVAAQKMKPIHTGEEILREIAKIHQLPHPTTISTWFREIGGFGKKKKYSRDQLKVILLRSAIYKKAQTQKENKNEID